MVRAVVARTVSAQEVELWVRVRRQSHWYDSFAHVYQALEHGAQFLQLLDAVSFDPSRGITLTLTPAGDAGFCSGALRR